MDDSIQHNGPDEILPSTCQVTCKVDQAVKLRADDEEIVSNPPVSVVTVFKKVADRYPDRIAIVDSYQDREDIYTYKRYYDTVIHTAKAFIKLGLKSFHGVGILGFNAPQWFISYFGSIFAGGIAVGMIDAKKFLYYVPDKAKCNIIVVENDKLLQILLEMADKLPNLKAIIQYRGQWEEIMEMKVDDYEEEFKRRIRSMAPNKCCTAVLTSGTTGNPKMAMLSHDNIIYNLRNMLSFINEKENVLPNVTVSYQNLCHESALFSDVYWPLICNGGTVQFAKHDALTKGTLIETLRKARPTFFCGIPKVFEMIMNLYLNSEAGKSSVNEKVYSWARITRQKNVKDSFFRNNMPIKFKFVKLMILRKIAAQLGLDRCRIALVGASVCKQEVLEFFLALNIPLLECYGMTEGGCVATNLRSSFKISSVGHIIPGVHFKLQQLHEGDGTEVCLNGRSIFMGYLNEEEQTHLCFDENQWFHTSDFGKLDEHGMLTLFGRLDDVIIASDSRKVRPLPVEKRILDKMPCLSYCVVVGNGRDFVNALLVFKTKFDPSSGEPTDFLDQTALDWCLSFGIKTKTLSDIINMKSPCNKIANEIQKVIERVNKEAASDKEIIHKWRILPKNFSVAGGELSLTMKLKRKAVNVMYEREISEFYDENEKISKNPKMIF